MTEIAVVGKRIEPGAPDDLARLYGDEIGYRVVEEVRSATAREAPDQLSLDAAPDDVIEIEDADGIITLRRVDSLLEEEGSRVRSDEPGSLIRAAATRDGLGSVRAVRRVEVQLPPDIVEAAEVVHQKVADVSREGLGTVVADQAARLAMKKITAWVDTPAEPGDPNWRSKPKPRGIYRIEPDIRLAADNLVEPDGLPSSDDAWLMLIHGTFSHTEGGFGALRSDDFRNFARAGYGERLLALEHATLGLTPAQNALDAARVLPEGARLHLISHSRGGMVGDVLAMAGAGPGLDMGRLERLGGSDHPDLATLPELWKLMADKDITVTRFARVACPARGTILASRRLDRYANYLLNAITLLPGLGDVGAAGMVKKLLLALLDKRSDPRLVPGIEAMMPESAFVAFLNTAPTIDDGMAAIVGDVEAAGVLQRFKVIAADLFYRADHDFVVDSAAMSGGVPRARPRQAFYRGPEVTHSTYFGRTQSRQALIRWLEGASDEIEGFKRPGAPPILSTARGASVAPAGTVVVVPDVFGSTLQRGEQTIWPSAVHLAGDVAEALAGPLQAVDATDVLASLRAHLSTRFEVVVAPYDWRMTVADSAGQVADVIAGVESSAGPIHVLAIGAGGLRVLEAYRSHPDLAGSLTSSGGRTVLVSPPLAGSWGVAALLAGAGELAAQLSLLDGRSDPAAIGVALSGLPGLAELHPEVAAVPADGAGAIVVFGALTPTITGADSDGFAVTDRGDGNVATDTPLPPNAGVRYAPMSAAALVSRPVGLRHLTELLQWGDSDGLLRTIPLAETAARPLPSFVHRIGFPGDADLAGAALGVTPQTEAVTVAPLRVSVVHGNLAHVRHPLLVGSQDGTPIKGAELALDRRMNRALSDRIALGQLAGRLGTCDVLLHPDGTPGGVVLGIGSPGELTPGQLTTGVGQAVLQLALAYGASDGAERGITISSVLIGTGTQGGLSTEASVNSLVNGVHRANRHLHDAGMRVAVDAIEIIELYEDKAIEATQACIRLAGEQRLDGAVVAAERFVLDGCGGLPGLPAPEYGSDTWRTIRVSAAPDAEASTEGLVALSFTSIGRSARAEQRVNPAQRRIIEHLIDRGVSDPRTDPQLYNTLYELLIPTTMKGQGQETENLMLVVDEAASAIPFELMGTRAPDELPVPLSTEVGMVRRLETRTFRESVRVAAGKRALVIGDPAGVEPRLVGARLEATRVADRLAEDGYQVTRLISESSKDRSVDVTAIMNALFAHDYRIVHIAAHGVIDHLGGGILIGDGLRLTANEVRQMRAVPDLVFLNACHVGSVLLTQNFGAEEGPRTNAPGRLAATLAGQLIDDGVRGFVSAAWAVDDAAAADFAESFYDDLLRGSDLGTAALTARRRVYQQHRHTNTWGAYHVYGPPAMRILAAGTAGSSPVMQVSRKQFRESLGRLRSEAARAAGSEADRVAARLAELVASVPSSWRGGGELALEGDVLFTLGDYREAIDRYRQARSHWGSQTPLRAIEQLANAMAKRAQQLLSDDSASEEGSGLSQSAETMIDGLLELGSPTPERLAIKGSFHRRRAGWVQDPGEDLAIARDAYERAARQYQAVHGGFDFYTGLNWVVLEWLVAVRGNRKVDPGLVTVIDECLTDARGRTCPDFWTRAAVADAMLARSLVERSLALTLPEVVAAYESALAPDASRRDRLSIVEHLDIIRTALGRRRPETGRALQAIRTALHPDLGGS